MQTYWLSGAKAAYVDQSSAVEGGEESAAKDFQQTMYSEEVIGTTQQELQLPASAVATENDEIEEHPRPLSTGEQQRKTSSPNVLNKTTSLNIPGQCPFSAIRLK